MSDDVLSVIPTDPHWQPDRAAADRAAVVLSGLELGDSVRVDVTWHKALTVVDCGGNLEKIECDLCDGSIPVEWWGDLLEAHCEDGFPTLVADVPCCGGKTSLDALRYDWPCGFARFEIAVWNPDHEWFSEVELSTVADALGHPVRQIRAHI
jgi:NAD-dependent SIR2 family protein deacetylase